VKEGGKGTSVFNRETLGAKKKGRNHFSLWWEEGDKKLLYQERRSINPGMTETLFPGGFGDPTSQEVRGGAEVKSTKMRRVGYSI